MHGNVELSVRQFVEAWRVLCTAAPGYSSYSEPGIECVFSGSPIAFFNAAILTRNGVSGDELQTCGRRASKWAAGRGVPWILIVTSEMMAPGVDCAASLDGCGFAPLMPLTGMLAQELSPGRPVPDGLELRVAEDDDGCELLLDVNSAAYGMSFDAGKGTWGKRSFWKDHAAVLGFAAGQPVCCSVTMMVDGYRYVALVATTPGQQRRGYADAAMRGCLEVARSTHGDCPTFLHATAAGRPVYERMGYQAVATHSIFMEKRFLEH